MTGTGDFYMVKQSIQDGEYKVIKGHQKRKKTPVRSVDSESEALRLARDFAEDSRGIIVFERETLSSQENEEVRTVSAPGLPDEPTGCIVVRPYSSNQFASNNRRTDFAIAEDECRKGVITIVRSHRRAPSIGEEIAKGLGYAKLRVKMPNRAPETRWEA